MKFRPKVDKNLMWEDYKKYSEGYEYEDELILASIEESHTIAFERVEEFIPDTTVRLPDFVVPAGRNEDDYLRDLSLGGLKLMGKLNDEYSSRLQTELKVIADRGFSKRSSWHRLARSGISAADGNPFNC